MFCSVLFNIKKLVSVNTGEILDVKPETIFCISECLTNQKSVELAEFSGLNITDFVEIITSIQNAIKRMFQILI
jgi:hypothetical protein